MKPTTCNILIYIKSSFNVFLIVPPALWPGRFPSPGNCQLKIRWFLRIDRGVRGASRGLAAEAGFRSSHCKAHTGSLSANWSDCSGRECVASAQASTLACVVRQLTSSSPLDSHLIVQAAVTKIPDWALKQQKLISRGLEAGKPRSRLWQIRCLVRAAWFRGTTVSVSPRGGSSGGALWGLLYKGPDPFMRPHPQDLTTS